MWQNIDEGVEEYLNREIANRMVREVNTIDYKIAGYTKEEYKCSWLISKWGQGIHLNRDNENGKYILFIQPDENLEAIALEFDNTEDIMRVIDRIILNVQIAKTFGKKLDVVDGERICLEGVSEYWDLQVAATLVKDELQILLDGKTLETTRKAGDILLEYANVGENVLDFQRAGYMDSTQVCLSKRLYDERFFLTREQKKGISCYKNKDFSLINSLLRGGEKNCSKVIDECFILNRPLTDVVNYILDIEDIAKSLPQRKYDIILNRKGSGVGKSVEEGSQNRYDSFVSFATNEGMRTFGNSGEKDISYKCVLKKDEPVIPIELLVPYVLKGFYPECEFLALPFLYEVDKYIEESRDENLGVKREPIVVMGNKKNISIKGLLEERIQELKRYIESFVKDKEYIDDVLTETQSEERTKLYREQGYEDDEEVEQINLLEILNHYRDNNRIKDIIAFDKKIQNDPNQYESVTHGRNHTRRVGFFARVIGENVGLSEWDMKILLYAIQNHDIGREHDFEDRDHGKKSVERLKQIREANESDIWRKKESLYDMDLVYFMIENHSKSASDAECAIRMLPETKQDRYRLMLTCLKDADKLDRIRLGKYDGLYAKRLQLPFSQKIVRMAYEVNDVWLNIADRLSGKSFDLDKFMMYIDESKKILQDKIQNPSKMNIERRKLEYYDDSFVLGDVAQKSDENIVKKPEEHLTDFVEKSEKQTSISAINQMITKMKERVGRIFKGKQTSNKSKDIK